MMSMIISMMKNANMIPMMKIPTLYTLLDTMKPLVVEARSEVKLLGKKFIFQ